MLLRLSALLVALALLAQPPPGWTTQPPGKALDPSPHTIDIPPWFRETFLDFREDIRDAAGEGRRLMVYFGQDGCPYCRELMRVNFSDKALADKMRRHFHAIAINIWGDRETTWIDGRVLTEKALAAFLKIQFTPTLLFLDEKGGVALRINGYYPPHRFHAALDYVAGKHESKGAFAGFLKQHAREPASGRLHDQPFFLKPPLDLDRSRRPGARPLAVLFEQRQCAACDELHQQGFSNPDARALVRGFDVARLELFGTERLVTPRGTTLTAEQWGRELKIAYTPTLVFFDEKGVESFRVEAYLRPFHLASSLDYVASGAYRSEPSFQRYIQGRAERI
ncbi:MAG: thioredoxin family protein, partial [Burkholderiales bacterium]